MLAIFSLAILAIGFAVWVYSFGISRQNSWYRSEALLRQDQLADCGRAVHFWKSTFGSYPEPDVTGRFPQLKSEVLYRYDIPFSGYGTTNHTLAWVHWGDRGLLVHAGPDGKFDIPMSFLDPKAPPPTEKILEPYRATSRTRWSGDLFHWVRPGPDAIPLSGTATP